MIYIKLTTYNEISTIPKVSSDIIFKAANGKSQIFNKVSKCA
jgi:hypothetical protein